MKNLMAMLLFCICFISCTKVKTKEVAKVNETTEVIQNNEDSVSHTDDTKYLSYEHIQTLDFAYGGFNIKVLESPFSDEVIYTIQKSDIIKISKVIELTESNKTFIEVTLPSNNKGYIEISSNPYQNGEYSYLETLTVDGIDIKILKISQSFGVSDGIYMKSLPSESSENVHEITHAEGANMYKAMAITSDYKWVKIDLNGYIGWVSAEYLGVNRGGPTINTPDSVIEFDLIGGNLI